MKNNDTKKTALITITVASVFLAASIGFVVFQSNRAAALAVPASGLDQDIAKQNALIVERPKEIKAYIALSGLYIQKVRETGDVSYYQTIDELLAKASAIEPENSDINAVKANIANGRHHFLEGYQLINLAIKKNPKTVSYYGIKADAEIELGKYDDAVATLQTMSDMKPNYSSYARIAYIRELYGDISGAQEALRLAESAGSNFKENVAWAFVESAKLAARSDLALAEAEYASAFAFVPDYAPALEGLGKVAFARGDTSKATMDLSKAFERLPLAAYAIDLGDVAVSLGDDVKAKQQYALASLAFEKSGKSGVDTNLEYSVFLSDHGDKAEALRLARQAYLKRPSLYGADALAWALYQNGMAKEAEVYSAKAMVLGENDPLVVFHSAMITESVGDNKEAHRRYLKVNELNPHFSIYYAHVLKEKLEPTPN